MCCIFSKLILVESDTWTFMNLTLENQFMKLKYYIKSNAFNTIIKLFFTIVYLFDIDIWRSSFSGIPPLARNIT